MVTLDQLVDPHHRYKQFIKVWDFRAVDKRLSALHKDNPHEGYGFPCFFRCLLLQFMEDLSDRELELFLRENISGKWFCGFTLRKDTRDHTVFSKVRKKIGTDLISDLFWLSSRLCCTSLVSILSSAIKLLTLKI